MPPFVEPSRARLPLRFAAISVLAVAAAGCSADVSRFDRGGPQYTASTNSPPASVTGSIPPAAPAPANAAPVGQVESRPLASGYGASSLPAPPPQYAASHAPAHPAPVARMPQAASAPPPAKSAVHVVERGDTLISIARRYGKSKAEIARANDIKPDTHVRLGQRLTIPGVAPSAVRAAEARPAAAPGRAPVSVAALPPRAPQTAAATPSKPQKPAAEERKEAVRGAPPKNLSVPEPERVERAAVAVPAAEPEAAASAPAVASAGKPSFRWPVRGRVIAGFGPRPSGQQNDGINLSVPEGTSVRAAEDGVVAYAGNELKGYGNLVLVRHSNGYVTAYAHASELKVKRGDRVRRGQIIALAGQTGGVSSPQLHFEVRRGSTPVDPTQYLASN